MSGLQAGEWWQEAQRERWGTSGKGWERGQGSDECAATGALVLGNDEAHVHLIMWTWQDRKSKLRRGCVRGRRLAKRQLRRDPGAGDGNENRKKVDSCFKGSTQGLFQQEEHRTEGEIQERCPSCLINCSSYWDTSWHCCWRSSFEELEHTHVWTTLSSSSPTAVLGSGQQVTIRNHGEAKS